MRLRPRYVALGLALAFLLGAAIALCWPRARAFWWRRQLLDSGGPLSAAQAAYDVRRVELAVRVEPARRAIGGAAVLHLAARAPLAELDLDLDRRMRVASVAVDGRAARFRHRGGKLRVALAPEWSAGGRHAVEVAYAGRPKVSAAPPWLDGFVWERTADGAPWVALSTQIDGADLWFPVKDHPSDEPDEGMAIELTVPAGLVGLANGAPLGERANPDDTVTSTWAVHYPINPYLVTVNVAPYVAVEERYRGADGSLDLPMTFWALPEHERAARAMWREAPRILATFARLFGEFPFLADKIAMVDSPLLGMEHQTLVAYGDDFVVDPSGIDETLVHELAHEWWGNAVSVADWDDFWIHEGFATYAEALYVEARDGEDAARAYLEAKRGEIWNERPLVVGRPRTAADAYQDDIYLKGAWVLHSLRWQIGDAAFFELLRRFAAPPHRHGLVSRATLAALADELAGDELAGFWRRYLERADPPKYQKRRRRSAPRGGAGDGNAREEVCFVWDDPRFTLALPVRVAGALVRLEMPGGRGCLRADSTTPVEVDTAGRILADPADDEG
jgi:aminopeptidase N